MLEKPTKNNVTKESPHTQRLSNARVPFASPSSSFPFIRVIQKLIPTKPESSL